MSKNNGQQPAFPVSPYNELEADIARGFPFGLTKREYFAAMAMEGMAASQFWAENFTDKEGDLEYAMKIAVKAADALLHQLNLPQ